MASIGAYDLFRVVIVVIIPAAALTFSMAMGVASLLTTFAIFSVATTAIAPVAMPMTATAAAFVILITVALASTAFMIWIVVFPATTATVCLVRMLFIGMAMIAAVAMSMSACNGYGFQLTILKLGDGFNRCLRNGSIDLNTLIKQAAQGVAVDAPAQHGINQRLFLRNILAGIDINVVMLARFGVKNQQQLSLWKMWLYGCLQPCVFQDGNA